MRIDDAPPSAGARAFAWTGALLFLVSLGYFLFTYAITFGETLRPDRPPRMEGRALAIDVALFTAFALHHTLFARERVRAWMTRVATPRLERTAYVWAASLLFIMVCAAWQPLAGIAWRVPDGWRWAAYLVQGFGIWLTMRSAAIIDVLDLAGVRQMKAALEPGRAREEQLAEFKTNGPYGWVRHPIYSGWFLIVFAAPTMTATRLAFAAISSAYLIIAIPWEERSLERTAGAAYARYKHTVRWKLVPWLY